MLLVLAACDDFPGRSQALACETTDQCDDGRICDRGFCVVGSLVEDGGLDAALDDAPPDAPPRACEATGLTCTGAVTVKSCTNAAGRTCWASCNQELTYDQAKARCTAWGGKLGPFITAEDDVCFESVRISGQKMWTALRQLNGQASVATGWNWNENPATPATVIWATGEPNDGNGSENNDEQCAYQSANNADNKAYDKPCSEPYRFACSF